MNTKMTLNLNKTIIDEAKSYSETTTRISPLVESLTGIISSEIDERKIYHDYLSKKHA